MSPQRALSPANDPHNLPPNQGKVSVSGAVLRVLETEFPHHEAKEENGLRGENERLMKENERLEEELRLTKAELELSKISARIDSLTEIKNRRAILEDGLKLLHVEQRKKLEERQYISIVMIDADHFKKINDTYGHYIGDKVLKRLAHTIDRVRRAEDIAGRWGGEEFLCILQHKKLEDIQVFVDRLMKKIGAIEVKTGDNSIHITASMGVSTFHTSEIPSIGSNSELLQSMLNKYTSVADNAMYDAKQAGRNCIRYN